MMEQKVVLITGGSRGIGAATARRFAAGGCKVVINYHRSQAQAEALAAEIGGLGGAGRRGRSGPSGKNG